jgi:hypothetical protein
LETPRERAAPQDDGDDAVASEMKKKKITKQRMAELMKTSRASGSAARSRQRQRHDRELATRRENRGAAVAAAVGVTD